jgi:hypothetical protein
MELSINEEWRELYDAEEELRTALKENPPADPNVAQAFKALLPVLANLTSELYYTKHPFQPPLGATRLHQEKRARELTDKMADALLAYWMEPFGLVDPDKKQQILEFITAIRARLQHKTLADLLEPDEELVRLARRVAEGE